MYVVTASFYEDHELLGVYDSYEKMKAAIEELAAKKRFIVKWPQNVEEHGGIWLYNKDGHTIEGLCAISKTEMNETHEIDLF